MFRNLLLILLCTLSFHSTLQSQSVSKASTNSSSATVSNTTLKIYPNPASNFFKLKQVTGVTSIIVYNLVGRKIKQFQIEKNKAYTITDLPKGMYLIQFLGQEGKILTTQRLSKR